MAEFNINLMRFLKSKLSVVSFGLVRMDLSPVYYYMKRASSVEPTARKFRHLWYSYFKLGFYKEDEEEQWQIPAYCVQGANKVKNFSCMHHTCMHLCDFCKRLQFTSANSEF